MSEGAYDTVEFGPSGSRIARTSIGELPVSAYFAGAKYSVERCVIAYAAARRIPTSARTTSVRRQQKWLGLCRRVCRIS